MSNIQMVVGDEILDNNSNIYIPDNTFNIPFPQNFSNQPPVQFHVFQQ